MQEINIHLGQTRSRVAVPCVRNMDGYVCERKIVLNVGGKLLWSHFGLVSPWFSFRLRCHSSRDTIPFKWFFATLPQSLLNMDMAHISDSRRTIVPWENCNGCRICSAKWVMIFINGLALCLISVDGREWVSRSRFSLHITFWAVSGDERRFFTSFSVTCKWFAQRPEKQYAKKQRLRDTQMKHELIRNGLWGRCVVASNQRLTIP